MRAHLVQLDIAWEDKAVNHRRVGELLAGVDVRPGDMIVLPEMFDTGFSLNIETTADADGATRRFLASLAERNGALVYGGFTMQGEDGFGRNRAHIYGGDGALLCEYDKVHPFSFGREPERFRGGGRVATCRWRAGENALTVCPAVCYDLRFPELFRAGLVRGAEAFVVGANWPAPRTEHWRALLIARAIENQAFVLGVNRAGADPHLDYRGGSLAVAPDGRILAELDEREGVATVELDVESLRSWRDAFPAWRDGKAWLMGRTGGGSS